MPNSQLAPTAQVQASPDPSMLVFARTLRSDLARLTMEHRFAVEEMLTKVSILREEFRHMHRYNPIEHVTSRIKSPQSIVEKLVRKGCELSIRSIRQNITDIAGIRITCSFITDTYRILDTLTAQHDLRVISLKDYIAAPKPNGYKSLHALLEIPVFLSDGPVPVTVEVQIRTIAMDFWASLEHKIYYKYDRAVPDHLVAGLTEAAAVAERLDQRMEQFHTEIHGSSSARIDDTPAAGNLDDALLHQLWNLSRQASETDQGNT